MKNKLLYFSKLILIIFVLLITVDVYAEDEDTQNVKYCLPNGNYYNVTWSKKNNSAVKPEMINEQTIKNGFVSIPEGTSEADKEKYRISPSLISTGCYIKEGETYTCPEATEEETYSISKMLMVDDKNNYLNVIFDFDISSGTYTVKLKDIYGGKVKIRAVFKQDETGTPGKSTDHSDFLQKQGNYYILKNVRPTTIYKKDDGYAFNTSKVWFVYYINNNKSNCNTNYIGSFNLVLPSTDEIEVENPALKDTINNDIYGCGAVKKYIQKLVDNEMIDSTALPGIKKIVNLCYKKTGLEDESKATKISYTDYSNLKDKISEQFSNLKNLVSSGSDDPTTNMQSSGDTFCSNVYTSKTVTVAAGGGSYWSYSCKEKYIIQGDTPKLVYAGDGFKYGGNSKNENYNTFKVIKTCTISHNKEVVLKPICSYSCDTSCTYTQYYINGVYVGPYTVTDDKGGPVEDFDACIETCDNGKYTQECINKCYKQVYGDEERNLPFADISNEKTKSFLDKMAVVGTITSTTDEACEYTGMSKDAAGRDKAMYSCKLKGKKCETTVPFSTYCDGHEGICTLHETVGPAGCSDNPYAEYAEEISKSYSEYDEAIAAVDKVIASGTYEINISDSYLNDGSGNAYIYTIRSDENKEDMIIDDVQEKKCNGESKTVDLGNASNDQVTFCSNNEITKTVRVQLVDSYVNKVDGTAIYETKSNETYKKFDVKSKTNRLSVVNGFATNQYFFGGTRYYTNLLSSNVNVNVPNDTSKKVTLKKYTNPKEYNQAKITVDVIGLGTNGNYNNGIDCYYGVYNRTLIKEPCLNPPCDDPGITIIFRPIDLKDNFPNDRNPRWNWTDNAKVTDLKSNTYKLLQYKVEPEKLTANIQEKEYSIYTNSAEVDYDITLTPENLRNIRQYNKDIKTKKIDYNNDGSYNYLDYDMECTNGRNRNYCISKFLSNRTGDGRKYIVYNGNTSVTGREDIAKCNNTYNGACVDAGGQNE